MSKRDTGPRPATQPLPRYEWPRIGDDLPRLPWADWLRLYALEVARSVPGAPGAFLAQYMGGLPSKPWYSVRLTRSSTSHLPRPSRSAKRLGTRPSRRKPPSRAGPGSRPTPAPAPSMATMGPTPPSNTGSARTLTTSPTATEPGASPWSLASVLGDVVSVLECDRSVKGRLPLRHPAQGQRRAGAEIAHLLKRPVGRPSQQAEGLLPQLPLSGRSRGSVPAAWWPRSSGTRASCSRASASSSPT